MGIETISPTDPNSMTLRLPAASLVLLYFSSILTLNIPTEVLSVGLLGIVNLET